MRASTTSFALPRIALLLLLGIAVAGGTLNECGGDRALSAPVGQLCDAHRLAVNSCMFGTVQCLDRNAITCVPNCSLTAKLILETLHTKNDCAPATAIVENQCVNGGTFLADRQVCSCPVKYTGKYCELETACVGVSCGKNGLCDNGRCVCDFMFTGDQCELRKDCQGANFRWTGTTCQCAPYFEGPECNRCVEGLICLPEQGSLFAYKPAIIRDPELLQQLLDNDPPDQYRTRPFVPSPSMSQQCQCSLPSISETKNPLTARYLPPNEYYASIGSNPEEYSLYIPHYYQHHHRSDNDDGLCSLLGFSVFLFLLGLIVLVLFYCVYRGNTKVPPPVATRPLTPTPPVPYPQQWPPPAAKPVVFNPNGSNFPRWSN